MANKDILLEIGLEELPARYVTDSMNQLADKVGNWLETMKINYRELKAFSTPRRLAASCIRCCRDARRCFRRG